jgi:SAM-dependent methyltransferase
MGLTETVAAKAVDTIFETIRCALKKGASVDLDGFGSFHMRGSVDDLDESLYLEKNADVRAAVERKELSSGRSHYLNFGQYENRAGTPPQRHPHFRLWTPVPPVHLRKRVHGREDRASFESVGETVARDLFEAVRTRARIEPDSRLLDFGCGCGRVLTYFRDSHPALIYGTDIDQEAIAWCKENIAEAAGFRVNGELPPLPFDDDFFDLIFSISIFTHLPETMQTVWLEELRRVSKPGALVLLSVHGEHLVPEGEARDQLMRTGFLYIKGNGTDGLPDFYQTTYHAEHYIKEHWGRFFHVEAILKRRINDHQDLVVCRSR